MASEPGRRKPDDNRELSVWYREFIEALPTSPSIAEHLKRVSSARDQWRRNFRARARVDDPAIQFQTLFPHFESGRNSVAWSHPICDDADELRTWLERYSRAERSEIEPFIAKVLALLSDCTNHVEAGQAAVVIGRTPIVDVPLAAISTAASALLPARCVPLCDAWLRILGRRTGRKLPNNVASYGELNAMALEWLEREHRRSPASELEKTPAADRLSSFCSWAVREKRAALSRASFAVSRNQYKDWPPMW